MTTFEKQHLPPCGGQSYVTGYSLRYAIRHPRKSAHQLPEVWRWLQVGEATLPGDVVCDRRIAPVRVLSGET